MEKQVALVTGSSDGIGFATVKYLAAKGYCVAATMRNGHCSAAELLVKSPHLRIYELDVTNSHQIDITVKKIINDFGRIDILINNAGYGLLGPFENASDQQIMRQINTNLMGVIRLTKAVIPYMRLQKSGLVINISSNAGRIAFPYYSYYNATKFAVEGLSESLAHELAPFGIRVKVVEPGPVKTNFFKRSADYIDTSGTIYANQVKRVYSIMRGANSQFTIPPDVVAKMIYEISLDKSIRLRYPAGIISRVMLSLNKILPEKLIFYAIRLRLFRNREGVV